MRTAATIFIGALVTFQPAYAQEAAPADFDVERLTGRLGIERSEHTEGNAVATVWTRNGVSVTRTVDGSNTTVFGNDNTGKGAVFCSWMIDVEIRADLELCPAQSPDLRLSLDQSIKAIDDFIVLNSYQPVTLAELQAREQARYDQSRQAAKGDPSGSEKLCTQGDAGKLISYMRAMSPAQRQQALSDLLSTPRWPVLNPCL